METRLTLRPGQNGTKKLLERYGTRLVRVRYLYDPQAGRRLKTVELIVESIVSRITSGSTGLTGRAPNAGSGYASSRSS